MRRLAVSFVVSLASACGADAEPAGGVEPHTSANAPLIASSADPGASAAEAAKTEPPKTCSPACSSIERCAGAAPPERTAPQCVPACPVGEVFIPATGPEGFTMGKGFTMNGGAHRLGKGHRPDSDRPHRVVLT